MDSRTVLALSITLSLAAGSLAGGLAGNFASKPGNTGKTSTGSVSFRGSHGFHGSNNNSIYRQVYKQLSDSVVAVKVTTASGATSQGSGFVYDRNGHIVTNHHVIKNAKSIQVRFRKGEWNRAKVVGSDVYSDLAVLKAGRVPSYVEPLSVAENNPKPGQIVMALGNPYGLEGSITHGIVSGTNRTMETTAGFQIPDTIQTDAAINPGNSGGPLVSTEGVVVGVNRAKAGDNIGFAISPEIISQVVPALIKTGDYDHAYLGARMTDVTPVIASVNNMQEARGVLVTEVLRAAPAYPEIQGSEYTTVTEQGRIPLGGDIILEVNGIKVSSTEQMISYLATETRPGEKVVFTLLRNGETINRTVELGKRPEPD